MSNEAHVQALQSIPFSATLDTNDGTVSSRSPPPDHPAFHLLMSVHRQNGRCSFAVALRGHMPPCIVVACGARDILRQQEFLSFLTEAQSSVLRGVVSEAVSPPPTVTSSTATTSPWSPATAQAGSWGGDPERTLSPPSQPPRPELSPRSAGPGFTYDAFPPPQPGAPKMLPGIAPGSQPAR